MFNASGPSLADIAAVTGKNGNNDGFGGNNGWWVLIILFALFGGWGNGWSNNGNNSNCCDNNKTTIVPVPMGGYGMGMYGYGANFTDAAVQRGFDTQTIITKLDGINSGICSLGYDQLAQMNGINSNVMQTGFGLQQAINNNTVAGMQNANALSTQLSDCCCENRQGQAQIQNSITQLGCTLQNTMNNNTRDLMESNNINFRNLSDQIKDGFNDLEKQGLRQENANLRQQLQQCWGQSLAEATARQVVNEVRPTPTPSWDVPNPWASSNCCCTNSCGR